MTEYGLLGPLQACRDGRPLPLGGPRQRAVLARLLLARGRAVPAGTLVDDVWGGCPPPTATKTLQKYVSELRKALGPDGAGRPSAAATRRVRRGDARRRPLRATARRRRRRRGARPLARGTLGDLPDVPFVMAERGPAGGTAAGRGRAARRDPARRRAGTTRSAAELAELRPPTRAGSDLTALLMLALYRSGRQIEALEAFQRHRRRLADELGIEPAEELRRARAGDPAPRRRARRTVPARAGRPAARATPAPGVHPSSGGPTTLARTVAALRGTAPVTLTGPGGVGKTRLALQAAAALGRISRAARGWSTSPA